MANPGAGPSKQKKVETAITNSSNQVAYNDVWIIYFIS